VSERFRAGARSAAAQYVYLEALPETGLGLGVEADLLFTLARHPREAVSREFEAIRVAVDIALERQRAGGHGMARAGTRVICR